MFDNDSNNHILPVTEIIQLTGIKSLQFMPEINQIKRVLQTVYLINDSFLH